MESNIQGLLEKIYEDGIKKAEKDSSLILEEAKNEAVKIIAAAEAESSQVRERAKAEARVLRESTTADLKTAAEQTLSALKSKIQTLIIQKMLDTSIKELSLDAEFMREMILVITKSWLDSGVLPDQIELAVPGEMKEKLEQQFQDAAASNLAGMEIRTGDDISGGFKISRNDKGYRMDFSEKALEEFFRFYLRKKTAEWLFED